MGRASRKKNRPRGQAGGLYSQIDKIDPEFESDADFFISEIIAGNEAVVEEKYLVKTESEFWRVVERLCCIEENEQIGNLSIRNSVVCLMQQYYKTYNNFYITSENIIDFIYGNKIIPDDVDKALMIF